MCNDKNMIDFDNLLSSDQPLTSKIVLIHLNTPLLEADIPTFTRYWKGSSLTASVDGAVNRLYDTPYLDREEFTPHLVTGDFDSARSEVLDFYKGRGSHVIPTPDQDETDFTKCLRVMKDKIRNLDVSFIVVYATVHGKRFDHLMASIDTLYKSQDILPHLPVCIVSKDGMISLLDSGSHILRFPSHLDHSKCGLIPVGKPCNSVTSTGLKWNVKARKLAFGELISACNELDTPNGIVTITTDAPLVWSLTLSE